MKSFIKQKLNRIALISLAASALVVGSSLNVFAADHQPANVTYNATSKAVEIQSGSLDAFKNLMPGGKTAAQEIVIRNTDSKKINVYFKAEPSADTSIAKELLDTLILEVNFKTDDNSAVRTLYKGPASGISESGKNIVADKILLGYIKEKSESGFISATLEAPKTMGNKFSSAQTSIKWVLQFEVADPAVESIPPESTPLGGPSAVPTDNSDLTKPPKTGHDANYLWVVLVAALSACVVIVAVRGKVAARKK